MECRSRPLTANTRASRASTSTPFHAKKWMPRSRNSRKSAPASRRSSADPSPGMSLSSPGAKFRAALAAEKPLQVPGAICAYHAILAEKSGYRAIYLSGGGVAAGSLGVPDLGISGLDDVLTDVRRITDASPLPLLVDVDTGFGASAFNVARTVQSLIKFGAAAMPIEGPDGAKRCGHRPNKELVSKDEMVDRIKAAVDAKTDREFAVMARTDALAVEGLDAAIDRASACVEAGADMIFPEAVTDLDVYRRFCE